MLTYSSEGSSVHDRILVYDYTLKEWVKTNNIPFSVGMVQGDAEKTRFAWGVRSLPWLIAGHERHHLNVLEERYGLG